MQRGEHVPVSSPTLCCVLWRAVPEAQGLPGSIPVGFSPCCSHGRPVRSPPGDSPAHPRVCLCYSLCPR